MSSSSSSSCIWCVDDSLGVSCESKNTRLRRRRETRAAREPQQVPGRIVGRVWTIATVKAQTGRGQVRLEAQRRRAAAPSAHDGAQNHRTRRLLSAEQEHYKSRAPPKGEPHPDHNKKAALMTVRLHWTAMQDCAPLYDVAKEELNRLNKVVAASRKPSVTDQLNASIQSCIRTRALCRWKVRGFSRTD